MKRLVVKPGFECIFALSLAAIIGLPPLVMGQDKDKIVKKQLEIKIKNGDTVVNGKNIKDMSAKERDEALDDFVVDAGSFTIKQPPGEKRHRIIIKRKGMDGKGDIVISRRPGPGEEGFPAFENEEDIVVNDSLGKKLGLKLKRLREMPEMAFNFDLDGDHFRGGPDMFSRGAPHMREFRVRPFDNFSRPNSQSFNYTNTDDEGISTHVSYRVNDASAEKLKLVAGVEKAELQLKDINVSPEFSTGKTTLKFNLPAKTAADVQFKDSQGKVLWSDKTLNGAFSKTFTLGLNGAYYLQVKQGGSIAVKRIVKED